MDSECRNILESLPEKPPRSRLEPYGELIDGMRRRGRTYRDVVEIFAEKCQLQVSISTLHDFLRARSRRNGNSATRIAADAMIAKPIPPRAADGESAQKPSEDEVRQRIAGLQSSQARDHAITRRLSFRPKRTASPDYAEKGGIEQVNPKQTQWPS